MELLPLDDGWPPRLPRSNEKPSEPEYAELGWDVRQQWGMGDAGKVEWDGGMLRRAE